MYNPGANHLLFVCCLQSYQPVQPQDIQLSDVEDHDLLWSAAEV